MGVHTSVLNGLRAIRNPSTASRTDIALPNQWPETNPAGSLVMGKIHAQFWN